MVEEFLTLDKLYEEQETKSEFDALYTKEEQKEILDGVLNQLTGHDFINDVYFTSKYALYDDQDSDFPGAQCLRVDVDMSFYDSVEDIPCGEDGVTQSDLEEAEVSFLDCDEAITEINNINTELSNKTFETEHFKIQFAYGIEAQEWYIEDLDSYGVSSSTEGEGDYSMRDYGYYREYTVTEGSADFTWTVQADMIIAVTRK